jgi:hypothetical protein
MADDRWLQWQQEYAGTNRLPGIWSVFLVLGLLAALALVLAAGPTATADSVRPEQGSLCDQHRGQPAWEAVCAEARRR